MPDIDKNGSRDWIRLASAWEVLCDFGDRETNRRAQLKEARQAVLKAPADQAIRALELLEFWRKKIQNEFAWRIYDGDFNAIGIDISSGVSNPENLIPHVLFDSTVESFSISWDENRMSVFGRTIVGIRVAPSEALLHRMNEQPSLENIQPIEVAPLTSDDFPDQPGATSYEQYRAEALLYLYKTYPAFEGVRLDRRIAMMVDYVDTNHPEIDTSWGFDRSSYYTTVSNLRAAGLLPSKNVQQ